MFTNYLRLVLGKFAMWNFSKGSNMGVTAISAYDVINYVSSQQNLCMVYFIFHRSYFTQNIITDNLYCLNYILKVFSLFVFYYFYSRYVSKYWFMNYRILVSIGDVGRYPVSPLPKTRVITRRYRKPTILALGQQILQYRSNDSLKRNAFYGFVVLTKWYVWIPYLVILYLEHWCSFLVNLLSYIPSHGHPSPTFKTRRHPLLLET